MSFEDELELLPLRDEQCEAVMPLIGPLLDAWDGLSNDARGVIEQESPQLAKALRDINDAMEGYDLLGEFTDRDVDYEFGREES